jgi:hypothetical protein
MAEPPPVEFCAFEVATPIGRFTRMGACRDGRIIDVNFATAWYLAQQGEPEAQRLADALVPPDPGDFRRFGRRAVHTAEELFMGAGPSPADWWRRDPPPRGLNGETLVYEKDEVKLLEDPWRGS